MYQSRQRIAESGRNLPRQMASDKAISRAIGEKLRQEREDLGLSRGQLVSRLPSGIGDRTLLSYEHGTRHLTVLRLIELCRELQIPAPELLTQALQRAQLELANLVLQVDLQAILKNQNEKFRPMQQWARNKSNEVPGGIAKLPPDLVRELATFAGYSYTELAAYLAKFALKNDDAVAPNDADTAEGGR